MYSFFQSAAARLPVHTGPNTATAGNNLFPAAAWWSRLELPTWGLIFIIYGGWLVCVLHWQALGPWLGTPLLIILTAWYMSLQHELIHGHPTANTRFNALLGQLPLAVWYPYAVYRDSHLGHHHNETLTLPGVDPETYYVSQMLPPHSDRRLQWRRFRNTSAGRLLIGPAYAWSQTIRTAWLSRNRKTAITWGGHAFLLAGMLAFLQRAGISPFFYVLMIAYPALSLTMVRSLFEHRAETAEHARSVINEAAWPWRLLFLNLNYHLVHHLHPRLPWFHLRLAYLAKRDSYLEQSEGFVEHGYLPLLWRYRNTPVIADVHPFA
ncbi:Fatty acid desaturase [Collimonas arenae]|uniref:Fatty acid desaturase n=1 Tax=Collimonas arenae TaxID=279058 RepID=A0A0A1FD64_9BURK|nr:fatty acid desaturase [Collimonas arenae]AIY41624.1 Fatty acid desaturase [Collimonas arenae]